MQNSKTNNTQSPFNRTAQHDAKRAAILSQAAKLFNSQGSRTTTLVDIADSLGLSKTSLYYYVKTKEELIYQCYLNSITHWQKTLDNAEAQYPKALNRIKFIIEQLFYDNWAAQNGAGPYHAQLLEVASLQRQQRKDIEKQYRNLVKCLQDTLQLGIDQGDIAPFKITVATQAFLGAVQWSFSWLHSLDKNAVEEAAKDAWHILYNGLSPSSTAHVFLDLPELEKIDQTMPPGFDRQEQQRLKQEAFYKIGTTFFNNKGFSGTSLDEIAKHLNVTKGAFYYHIKNKENLLNACYERSIDISWNIHLQARKIKGTYLQKIEYSARKIFWVQISDQGPLIRYNSITALPMSRRKVILTRTRKNRDITLKALKKGIEEGSVRADINTDIAERLLSGALNAAMEIENWQKITNSAQTSADYFSLLFNGLKPRVTT